MKLKYILIGIILVLLGALTQSHFTKKNKAANYSNWTKITTKKLKKTILLDKTKQLSPTQFTTHKGQSFHSDEFKGKWSLLFFGFTHCPDVCPTTLHVLKKAKQTLSEQKEWAPFQVYLVSVDPARDTVEKLNNYVPFFDEEFIGLRSDEEATHIFAKNLGILFRQSTNEQTQYNVDHSSSIIILNPNGEMAGVKSAPHQVETIIHDLSIIAKQSEQLTFSDSYNKVQPSSPALDIKHAWIRPAPTGSNVLAAYAQLMNHTHQDIVIQQASSHDFNSVMFHKTKVNNDIVKMEHLENLTIPANSVLTLAPQSTHFMLMNPVRALSIDDTVTLNLTDQNGKTYPFHFPIRNQPNQNTK